MKKLCTILARGGSKGLPNKNIKILAGKPLIAHTIEQAKNSGMFDVVSVSSDSQEILEIARKFGADTVITRPPELASDFSPKLPAIQHCLIENESQRETLFDVIVDLDPTSPLRHNSDLAGALNYFLTCDATNLITGCKARKSPYFNMVELNEDGIARTSKSLNNDVQRRQDSPKVFEMNASIYIWWRSALIDQNSLWLEKTRFYEMPVERSVDIDSSVDFKLVEILMEQRDQN